jgi:CheY-like chemotaxis protein
VIENIITNAKEAMPHGGKLTIHCENYTIWPDTILPLQAGSYLKITIKDTGPGIPEDIIGKIFDPFFTTRLMGNGLGLTTSYSIIKKHGGYIDTTSEPGNGAIFSLYLPASQAMELKKTSVSQVSNGGRILIVDDEDFIREVASQILKKAGYKTYLAANCDEACALYQQSFDKNEHIDFVILDLTIPGGPSGAEIAIKLRQINPDSIFIVASGYSDDPVMANPSKYGFSASISKPFRIHELTDILIKTKPMVREDVRYLKSDI